MKNRIHVLMWRFIAAAIQSTNRFRFEKQKDDGRIFIFDTSADTDNLGDYIIMKYCNEIIQSIFPEHNYVYAPTHSLLSEKAEEEVQKIKYKFVCGTNILNSHVEEGWNWILPDGIRRKIHFRNTILMGVGWKEYQGETTEYTKMVYKCMFNPNVIHSVRDAYTENQLHQIGIKNVVNTGCPTMWKLTPELCKNIPTAKSKNVVTTLTDYRRNPERDQEMLNILSRNYSNVYLWLQGDHDEEYLHSLEVPENLITIPHSFEAYDEALNQPDIDYVGTRLHAGIFALNHQVRSIIIAVDNRAIEIAKDTGLPIVRRKNIDTELEKNIRKEFKTEIHLQKKNIDRFLGQFIN